MEFVNDINIFSCPELTPGTPLRFEGRGGNARKRAHFHRKRAFFLCFTLPPLPPLTEGRGGMCPP